MTAIATMNSGNYLYIPSVFQYSAGVAADCGFAIERVRFSRPISLYDGFNRIAEFLEAAGRPLTALCACELRSPGQFTEAGFEAFNREYVGFLRDWGICDGDDNPVARSNVCPEANAPDEPGFYAFSFTSQSNTPARSFVISGGAETQKGQGAYETRIIRYGEQSTPALREKAQWVLSEMEWRMGVFGASWQDITAAQLYTVHDVHPFVEDELARRGVLRHGLTWHFDRPPVLGLEYEMDCRCVRVERVQDA